jgi:hypothetical protein
LLVRTAPLKATETEALCISGEANKAFVYEVLNRVWRRTNENVVTRTLRLVFLLENDINSDKRRIKVYGAGKSLPLSDNRSGQGRPVRLHPALPQPAPA